MRDAAAAGKGGNYGCKRQRRCCRWEQVAAVGARTQETGAEVTAVKSESKGMNVSC